MRDMHVIGTIIRVPNLLGYVASRRLVDETWNRVRKSKLRTSIVCRLFHNQSWCEKI